MIEPIGSAPWVMRSRDLLWFGYWCGERHGGGGRGRIAGAAPAAPTVVDGNVLLQGTLVAAADSDEAMETVKALRSDLASAVQGAVAVGGTTATSIDTIAASIRDRTLIIPVVLVVITLILMALLRSVLAPVLLILTTVLSFGAIMGVAALVFNGLLGFPVPTRPYLYAAS